MKQLQGKKLLILGGAFQHCKVVEAAKKLGVITYVTDYLPVEESPAKQIADHYWMYNITQVDEIVEECKKEGIDGAISLHLDPCQHPYQQICERCGYYCFGTKEQFHKLTDKQAFKKACVENGIDVIPEYNEDDFQDEETCRRRVEFPVFIKPCDSRGSRGQAVCNSHQEAVRAIEEAKHQSLSGRFLAEKYMGYHKDFSMSYIVINGEPIITRTDDRYLGDKKDGFDRMSVLSVSPSLQTDMYLHKVDEKISGFLKAIGLYNAPAFMQGFLDGDTVRLYDPGLRFPGCEYERMYEKACGINPIEPLIKYALTGVVSDEYRKMKGLVTLKGHRVACVMPPICSGTISQISGIDEIRANPKVVSAFLKYRVGDFVEETHNVSQRFGEIDIVCKNSKDLVETVNWIYEKLVVLDGNGNNMLRSYIDTNRLLGKESEVYET